MRLAAPVPSDDEGFLQGDLSDLLVAGTCVHIGGDSGMSERIGRGVEVFGLA